MNENGQAVISEYILIILLAVAAVTAMTTFVQRGIQGRIHDAKDFMITSVINSDVCDANCLQATGGNIYYEYEPYYSQTLTYQQQIGNDDMRDQAATKTQGAIYGKTVNELTQTNWSDNQMAPGCAGGGC